MFAIYRRFTISAKLAIAGLVMLIPMTTLYYFMEISFRHDIRIGHTELAGTECLREAFKLQHLLTERRTQQLLDQLPANVRAPFEIGPIPTSNVDEILDKMSIAVSGDLSHGPTHAANMLSCISLERTREAWKWYDSTGRSVAYEDASAAMLALFVQIANCANLALDPALDSQMLGRAVSLIPEVCEVMAGFQWLALELGNSTDNTLTMPQRDTLITQAAFFKDGLFKRTLDDSRTAMAADEKYYTFSPTLTLHYGNALDHYQKASEKLLDIVERLAQKRAHPSELFNAANEVRSAGQNLFSTAMDELDILVQKRIDGYQTWRIWGIGLSLAGIIAAFLLLTAASRSISRGVLALVDFSQRVTSGDYDARVDTNDLGPKMREMVKGTGKMVADLKNTIGYYNGIMEGLTVPCFVVDRDQNFTYINKPFLDLFESDASVEEMIGKNLATEVYGNPEHQTISGHCMRIGAPITNQNIEYKTPKGNMRYVRFDVAPLFDLDKKLIGAFGLVSDMTKITAQKEAIERLAAFPREAPAPVLSSAGDGRIQYMNNAASDLFESSGASPDDNFLPESHVEIVASCLSSGSSRYGIESTIGSNTFSWTYHPLPKQDIVHMYASDISKRLSVEKQMLHDAFHDKLTGLPNKALFLDRVNQTFRRARRQNIQFAVLFLDLDGFKTINDSLGHAAGDKLLTQFAWRAQNLIGPDETVARLGGDEFTVLLPVVNDENQALKTAEAIQADLNRPFEIDGTELFISASIGVMNAPDGAATADDLLRDAETAMYEAKASGRANATVFDTSMHKDASDRLQMENDLKKAVDNGEFLPYYQPIVTLNDGHIVGFEALIRWEHPVKGVIPPARFIPLAEETGLIVPMGAFMLEEACKQGKLWQETFPTYHDLTISVNLSVEQMTRNTIGGEIRSILEHTGIPLSTVKIEITESGIMDNVGSALELLNDLENMGVSLMIDDFGTGYSSLSHLHQFPFHYLKIDRSFISSLEEEGDSMEIVRTIVSLAHALGKKVVAEGVETESQLKLLRKLGCEYAQGYYFARPLRVVDAEVLLTSKPRW